MYMDIDKVIRCGTVGIVFQRIINFSILHGLVGSQADMYIGTYLYIGKRWRCIVIRVPRFLYYIFYTYNRHSQCCRR